MNAPADEVRGSYSFIINVTVDARMRPSQCRGISEPKTRTRLLVSSDESKTDSSVPPGVAGGAPVRGVVVEAGRGWATTVPT